jgi:hypothetical protein
VNLSAPKQATFYVAALCWLLGLLGAIIPAIGDLFSAAGMSAAYWLAILGGLILIVGNAMDGI